MSVSITSTDPRGLYPARTIEPIEWTLTNELEESATLEMTFEHDWDLISSESDPANTLALGSFVLLIDDGETRFRGKVYERENYEIDGERFTRVVCLDKFGTIRETMAHDDGSYIYTKTTPALAQDQVSLKYLGIEVDEVLQFFPDPAELAAWLPSVSYAITAVNTGSKTFTIAGDHSLQFYAGVILRVYGSTGNDAYYTVVTGAFGGANTVITVAETVPDSTADGLLESEYRTNYDALAYPIVGAGHSISAIDQTPVDIVTIGGDFTAILDKLIGLPNGISIVGSTGNDAGYTILSTAFVAGNTEITVSEQLPDATADGVVHVGYIVLSSDYKALLPVGLVMIDSTAYYYDAYFSLPSGEWVLKVMQRAAIETTAGNHVAADEVRQLIPLKIHPNTRMLVEGLTVDSPEWGALSGSQYFPQPEEGRVDITQPIDQMLVYLDIAEDDPRTGYSELRASYAAFDEMNATAIKLSTFAADVFEGSKALGGPGLTSAEYDVTMPSIRLTRVVVDEPKHCMDLLNDIKADLAFQGSGDLEVISSFYNSRDDLMTFKTITQKSTPDVIFGDALNIQSDYSLADIYSGIVVKFKDSGPVNLANRIRSWVPAIGDSMGSEAENMTAYLQQKTEQPSGFGWESFEAYSGTPTDREKAQGLSGFCFDGLDYTGFGIGFADNPGSNVTMMYCWWSENAETRTIDHIRAVFDVRRQSDPTYPIDISVVGFTSFTPPVYDMAGAEVSGPVEGGEIPLNGALRAVYNPDEDTDSVAQLTLEASGIGTDCNAIGIRFDGIPATRDNFYRCMLRELLIEGFANRAVFVRLSDGYVAGDPIAFLAAEDSYSKLIDAEFGNYKIDIIDAGVVTKAGAVGLGRLALLQALTLAKQRIVAVPAYQGYPVLGETTQIPGPFTGVCLSSELKVASGGGRTLNLRLIDLEEELI